MKVPPLIFHAFVLWKGLSLTFLPHCRQQFEPFSSRIRQRWNIPTVTFLQGNKELLKTSFEKVRLLPPCLNLPCYLRHGLICAMSLQCLLGVVWILLKLSTFYPNPSSMCTVIQLTIGRSSGRFATPLQVPQVLFFFFLATPSGPGCPGSSPSFRPLTSQLAPAHSLEVALSLQAPSQGGITTP